MPDVKALLFCEGVQQMPNGKLVAVGILNEIVIPTCPTAFTFGIVSDIRGISINTDVLFSVKLLAPNGDVAQEQTNSIRLQDEKPAILAADIRNVLLKVEGQYVVQVIVNGSVVGESDIVVKVKAE